MNLDTFHESKLYFSPIKENLIILGQEVTTWIKPNKILLELRAWSPCGTVSMCKTSVSSPNIPKEIVHLKDMQVTYLCCNSKLEVRRGLKRNCEWELRLNISGGIKRQQAGKSQSGRWLQIRASHSATGAESVHLALGCHWENAGSSLKWDYRFFTLMSQIRSKEAGCL